MATLPELIGRAPILARIERARADGQAGVVLVGDGGVGKTRIAAEVLARAAERGDEPLSTVGTHAAAGIPLGALSHLLPDLSGAGGNILIAARDALVARARGRTLVIAVDDAHLLDDHSAALLLHLAFGVRSFIVVTARRDEPLPDAITALWKDGLAERIEVGELPEAAIGEIIGQALGGPPDALLVREVTRLSGGNPLYVRELCLEAQESDALERRDGWWALTGRLRASRRLVELVAGRIAHLGESERQALDLIAHGEPIGLRVAERSVDPEVLVSLERRGLIALREDGRRRELRVAHPIQSEVVRATTGALRVAMLKRDLAGHLEALGMRRRDDLLRVATYQVDAGEADAELLLRAAHETYRALDMAGTARLAAGAWDRQPSASGGLLLGTALAFLGRHDEADAAFAAATAIARDEAHQTWLAVAHSSIMSTGLGQPEEAQAVLADAETHVADPGHRRILRAQRGHLLALQGRPVEALELVDPVLEPGEGVAYVTAAMAAVIALGQQGAYEAQAAIAAAALPETRRLWDDGVVSIPPDMLRLQEDQARAMLGASARSERVASGPTFVAHRPLVVLEALQAADACYLEGRCRTAAATIAGIAPMATDLLAAPCASAWALYEAISGRTESATDLLALAERWTRDPRTFDPFHAVARLWTLTATGHHEEARASAVTALEASMDHGRWGVASFIAHELARTGGARAALAGVARIGDRVDGPFARARHAHIEAIARGDAQRLDQIAAVFADLGAMLFAAEAAAEASRRYRATGETRRAARLRRMVAELLVTCETPRTPALQGLDALTPLTPRETEIAALAARGLPSDTIARRLHLSTRTVDNHLGRVYEKTGVTSRAELGSVLDHPLDGA